MLRANAFQPPEDGLPPQEVRIVGLYGEAWQEDRRKVRIHLEVTPFLERPDLEVVIADDAGQEVSSINIIENIEERMTFTMHIRGEEIKEQYLLIASVIYPEVGQVDQKKADYRPSLEDQS